MHEIPERVVYRDNPPGFELELDAIPDDTWNVPNQKLIKSLFLTKGDKWIYEKEHRSILKLGYADKIVGVKDWYLENICDGIVDIVDIGNGLCEIYLDPHYDTGENEDVNGEGLRVGLYVHAQHNVDTLHFFRLNPKVVTGIYFGCKVDQCTIHETIEIIRKNNSFLDSIKFKQATLIENKFELSFNDIKI